MNSDIALLQSLVPDVLKIVRQRFLVLEQVALLAPVGRRTVAQKLGLSERKVRTETEYLRHLDLIAIRTYGMVLTDKGKKTMKDIAPILGGLFNTSQIEKQLAKKFGIERVIVVPGDSARQDRVYQLMSEQLNAALDLLLQLGENIITVLGGSEVAAVAKYLSPKLSRYRDLLFVSGRGALGESVELQSNTVAQKMASRTGGRHQSLYLPENVEPKAFNLLIQDKSIGDVVSNIYKSDAVIHGIGLANRMVKRRGLGLVAQSELRQKDAVAECFEYFFDHQGKIVATIPRIGLQLEDLEKIPHVFAIASGSDKAAAISAYMHHAPRQTWLITDEGASKKILKGI